LLEVACEVANTAGAVLLERFGGPASEVRAKSSPTDLVSEADLTAERALREALAVRRPEDGVLGEEGSDEAGSTGLRWVIDPLDGTVNFLFGIPQWAVSVACEDAEGTLVGAVADPLRGEMFTAQRGGPATLDGMPLVPSERDELARAMVATGFAYDAGVRAAQAEVAARLLPEVRDIRRLGSAALDLAWTACGRYDAFYERGLNPWDRAAGELICRSAGLEVRELAAAEGLPDGLLVAPRRLVEPLERLVSA
ncbi:MAG TPA: inositol monophosphatase family protein, partial [Vicinamibacteria bacterium]|nr:inositol monophosphatase family protein [Vicinamibacteria bacterium]